MQIVDAAKIEPRIVSGHRTGDIVFQRLLQGTPNTSDNFEFSLVRNRGSYYTPRHRHNFDQIRMVMEGKFAYAGRKAMRAGSVSQLRVSGVSSAVSVACVPSDARIPMMLSRPAAVWMP